VRRVMRTWDQYDRDWAIDVLTGVCAAAIILLSIGTIVLGICGVWWQLG
jgi:hypothetical protein